MSAVSSTSPARHILGLFTALRPSPSRHSISRRLGFPSSPASFSTSAAGMAPNKTALDFVDFVNASPTPYHAVESAAARFEAAGFTLLRERDSWASALRPGGKYYVTRNGSSILAFAVGARWRPGNPIAMVGAHTDSCTLRLKPVSSRTGSGYMQVGVEAYGGGIWHSWFDRDLSLAGRVLVRDGEGGFVQRLVKVDKPLLRIPTLAIHLHRQSNFDPNKETELFPIAGLVAAELNKGVKGDAEAEANRAEDNNGKTDNNAEDDFQPLKDMSERHHPAILDVVARELGTDVAAIADFELVLYDTQKACIGGLDDEFIFSARLDNLGMTYCSVMGLIESVNGDSTNTTAATTSLRDDSSIRLAVCFDHEEIGSQSAQGAHSNFLPSVLRRLASLPSSSRSGDAASDASYDAVSSSETVSSSAADDVHAASTAFEQTLSRSFLISADMAHAVHPNYAGKAEANHQPQMNRGPVIKINANQRYATNSPGIVLVQECARAAAVPLQLFVVRNDCPCGSTIGPGLAARLGVRTLDIGNPQLSMHSIRETGGSGDVEHAVKLFSRFYSSYAKMESKILVD